LSPGGAEDFDQREFDDLTQTFEATTIPVRTPLVEIYRGVVFPENAGR